MLIKRVAFLLCCLLLCTRMQVIAVDIVEDAAASEATWAKLQARMTAAVTFSPEVAAATAYAADIPYVYPYRAQTHEWDALGSYMNRLMACCIPDVVLARMSTPALLQTIYDYPFLSSMAAFNTLESGFQMARAKFNGMNALLAREDCFETVYAAYQSQNMNLDEAADASKAYLQVFFLETLTSQEVFLSKLTLRERMALAILADEKNIEKRALPQIYGPQPKEIGRVVALAALLSVASALLLCSTTLLAARVFARCRWRVPVLGRRASHACGGRKRPHCINRGIKRRKTNVRSSFAKIFYRFF